MALIRNFPVPSDRMAIISTLLNIEDAVVWSMVRKEQHISA